MGDIFLAKEARAVLANKHIAIIGGSNMRGLYKDIVWLINDDSIIPKEVLGEKAEKRFPDFNGTKWAKSRKNISARLRRKFSDDNRDVLIRNEGLHPGRTYKEPRFYYSKKSNIMINFLFVTRVWTPEIDKWLHKQEDIQDQKLDLIIMNSLLWDVNRWGPNGIDEYKKNLTKLLATVKNILSEDGLFIWLTAQPGSAELNSAAMETRGLEFQKTTTRFNVIQANFYTAHEVANAGYEVIDLHYYFLLQTFRRNRDGIHWSPEANRYVTNLVLTHISLAYKIPLPNRNVTDYALKRVIYMSELAQGNLSEEDIKEKIKELDNIAQNMVRQGGDNEVQLPALHQINNNMMVQQNPFANDHSGPMPFANDHSGPMPFANDHLGPMPFANDHPGPMPFANDQRGPMPFANDHPGPMIPPMQQTPHPRPYPDPWIRGPMQGPNGRPPPWAHPNFDRPGPCDIWGPRQPQPPGFPPHRARIVQMPNQQLPWNPPIPGPHPFGMDFRPDFRFNPNFRFN